MYASCIKPTIYEMLIVLQGRYWGHTAYYCKYAVRCIRCKFPSASSVVATKVFWINRQPTRPYGQAMPEQPFR